jgi:hypothetical protein
VQYSDSVGVFMTLVRVKQLSYNSHMQNGLKQGDGMDWIDLTGVRDQCRPHVNTAMNLQVPSNAGRFLSGFTASGLKKRAQLCGVG